MSANLVLISSPFTPSEANKFIESLGDKQPCYPIVRVNDLLSSNIKNEHIQNAKIFLLGNYKQNQVYNSQEFKRVAKDFNIQEIIPHSCITCEWCVKVQSSDNVAMKACNALQGMPDNEYIENTCTNWEAKDYQAQSQRNAATQEKVNPALTVDFPLPVRLSSADYFNRMFELDRIDGVCRPINIPQHHNHEFTRNVLTQIEMQLDFIYNYRGVRPTKVLIDTVTFDQLVRNDVMFERNISSPRILYWRGLEVIRCHSIPGHYIVQVLFPEEL